jgi:hypothetical protein
MPPAILKHVDTDSRQNGIAADAVQPAVTRNGRDSEKLSHKMIPQYYDAEWDGKINVNA